MKTLAVAFGSGLLFAIGLGISGMTNPNKVMNFLDVAGNWDASLAFVMAGAVGVNLILFRWIFTREKPMWTGSFQLPTKRDLDSQLITGSTLFGIGWGLAGFCPGPALVTSVTGNEAVLTFVGAMLAGMVLQHFLNTTMERRVHHGTSAALR